MDLKQKKLIVQGEPSLGSIYTDSEIRTVNKYLLESIKPDIGFRARKETLEFEEKFMSLCNVKYATALNGAGAAIDLVLKTLEIRPSDEIISCSLNFPGTHLSVIGSGAKLILSEPDPHTINLDPHDLGKRLTKKTRAIIVTYMNGLAADIDLIKKAINDSGLYQTNKPKIIVDAARSLGTTYKCKHVGSEAWTTVFSFQSKKMITTLGEGSMVVTNDPRLDESLKQYRSFGMNIGWGSNYKMTKVQAAVGLVQLRKLNRLVKARRKLANQRNKVISKRFPEIIIQKDTNYSDSSYYLYTLILPKNSSGKKRNKLMKVLDEKYGIGSVIGNPPTYYSNPLIRQNVADQKLPIAEDLGQRIICLSIHPAISDTTNKYIINSFIEAYEAIFN